MKHKERGDYVSRRYLVIADDFTGANDTGVQLRRRGYPTEVVFATEHIPEDRSIVIDTESRTGTPQSAYETVKCLVQEVDFQQYEYVIKKVDSTMRGNIPQEIKALDEVYEPELIIFAPALPNLGRTTIQGVQCLNGVEICKTELARDPKNPVMEDSLVRLLEQVYHEPVQLKTLEEIRAEHLEFSGGRIFACDAETNENLQAVVRAVRAGQKKAMYIGTAGIADNIMEIENPTKPVFGVVASISTVTNRQIQYCEGQGITMIKVPIHDLLSGEKLPQPYREEAVAALKRGEDTILLANTSYDRDEMQLSREAGAKRGLDIIQIGDYVQEIIGKIAEQVLERTEVSGVFVTGGDTALGMLRNIEAEGADILTELLVGIPMVRVTGGRFDGLKMVTKAGAFGSEDAVSFAFRKIKEAN
ncbi:MAG: four-carbon acid sugar kinase family protein [Lachnospiraceae bacterium]|nr:four-carbon acid sugar kinase family protein [Lachnospiraceae bacterium]